MFRTIDADKNIITKVALALGPPDPVDGYPEQASESAVIPLQFPPRIRGFSKQTNWNETPQRMYEPVAVFEGSEATEMTLELQYVVTNHSSQTTGMMVRWDVESIAKATHTVMAYFYRTVKTGRVGKNFAPVVRVELYEVAPYAGGEISTWRMMNANLEYSDELILQNGKVFPQVTTVTMQLAMLTMIGFGKKAGGPDPVKQEFANIPKIPLKEWY
jgi:hypothetical protein